MNTKNLETVAAYLESGDLKAAFNMQDFAGDSTDSYGSSCGSVGCAIGHGPYAGIPKLPDEDWCSYSDRVFGLAADLRAWDWCFSGAWVNIDNTPRGAAKRIRYLLANGRPPEWFDIQWLEDPGVRGVEYGRINPPRPKWCRLFGGSANSEYV